MMEIKSFVKFETGYNMSPNTRTGKVQVLDGGGNVLVEHVAWKEYDSFVYEKPYTAGRFIVSQPGFGEHKAPEVTEEQASALLRLAEVVEVAGRATDLPVKSDRCLLFYFEDCQMASAAEEARLAVLAAFS